MAFVKLSRKEKWYIVEHPEDSPGNIARALGHLFRDTNGGSRCALTVRNFRNTDKYKEMYEMNQSKGEGGG